MSKPNKIMQSPELIAQLKERWASGDSLFTIAVDMEITEPSVMNAVRKLGLPERKKFVAKAVSYPWTPEQLEKMQILFNSGMSMREISIELGMGKNGEGKNTVIGKIRRLGWPKRESPIKPKPPETKPSPEIKLKSRAVKQTEVFQRPPSVMFASQPHFSFLFSGEFKKPKEPKRFVADGPVTPWPKKGNCQFAHNNKYPWDFCTRKADGFTSWCKKHHDIVFNKINSDELTRLGKMLSK
jgi:hypothetical protein